MVGVFGVFFAVDDVTAVLLPGLVFFVQMKTFYWWWNPCPLTLAFRTENSIPH